MASGLHHENIAAANILLNLHIHLAIGKASNVRLPARHPEKSADLVGQRLVRRAAKNLELIVHPGTLRLAIWLSRQRSRASFFPSWSQELP